MLEPTPYRFERDFDALQPEPEAAVVPDPDADPVLADPEPASAPRYDDTDLARARDEGRAEGRAAAISEAAQAVEHRIAATVDRLGAIVAATVADRDAIVADCERRAGRLAAAIVRRIIPLWIEDQGPAVVADAVGRVLGQLRAPQRLTARVAPAEHEAIADRLAALHRESAAAPLIHVVADPAIAGGDCRIEWEGGHAVRDTAALWRAVDAIVANSFGADPKAAAAVAAAGDAAHEPCVHPSVPLPTRPAAAAAAPVPATAG